MPDPDFHFAAIPSAGEWCWHVRRGGIAGLFLGTVVKVGRHRASWPAGNVDAVIADRDTAAQWLASIAPK